MAYGIVVDVKKKDVLIVGGGNVAFRKAKRLLKEGARVHLAAPEIQKICMELQVIWPKQLSFSQTCYHEDLLEGRDLVITAASDEDLNRQVHKDCRNRHILCNNTSDYTESDFWNMSSKERFGISFFASSGGGAPGLTGKILEEVVHALDEGLLKRLEEYGNIRREIRLEKLPAERRRLLKKLMHTPLAQLERWQEISIGGKDHED